MIVSHRQYNEFLEDLEEDELLRKNVNIFRGDETHQPWPYISWINILTVLLSESCSLYRCLKDTCGKWHGWWWRSQDISGRDVGGSEPEWRHWWRGGRYDDWFMNLWTSIRCQMIVKDETIHTYRMNYQGLYSREVKRIVFPNKLMQFHRENKISEPSCCLYMTGGWTKMKMLSFTSFKT